MLPSRAVAMCVCVCMCVCVVILLGSLVTPVRADSEEEAIAARLGITVEQVQDLKRSRGLTNERLAAIPSEAVPRLLKRLSLRRLPEQRLLFRDDISGATDPDLPPGFEARALRQARRLRETSSKRMVAGVPVAAMSREAFVKTARLDSEGWRWLGPGNIGGIVWDLIIHPTEHDRMWAASPGGGVWTTRDGGGRWEPVMGLATPLTVSNLALDPQDPQVLYAGTGFWQAFGHRLVGSGMLKSTDGGESWEPLPSTQDKPEFRTVTEVAISPDGSTLMVASANGLHRSTDGGEEWSTVLRHWVDDVTFHPTDSSRVVAVGVARVTFPKEEHRTVAYHSRDGGKSWAPSRWGSREGMTGDQLHELPNHIKASTTTTLIYASANADVVYASLDLNNGIIARSKDGGATFEFQDGGSPARERGERVQYMGDQGFHNNVIWAGHPDDPDFLLVGGIDVWRSHDGGDTLENISDYYYGREGTLHPDQHAIVSHPAFDGETNRTIFFGTDGGVYRAKDILLAHRGGGWDHLNTNFGATQFYGAAGYGTIDDGFVFGGTQDNGTLYCDLKKGPHAWEMAFGGDGGKCAVDPEPHDGVVWCYGESQYGSVTAFGMLRTPEGGFQATKPSGIASSWLWRVKGRGWTPVFAPPHFIPGVGKKREFPFVSPLTLDPNDRRALLVAGRRLWRTHDATTPNGLVEVGAGQGNVYLRGEEGGGGHFLQVSGPSWECVRDTAGTDMATSVCIEAGEPGRMWVGYKSGALLRTESGASGKSEWTSVAVTEGGIGRACLSVTVHPENPEVVYATFAGYEEKNVWRTKDGGSNWVPLGPAKVEAPVWALTVHPDHPAWVYIGTEVGLFASADGGDTWSGSREGPVECAVQELFWLDRTLVAATYGRGMYAIDLSPKKPPIASEPPPLK